MKIPEDLRPVWDQKIKIITSPLNVFNFLNSDNLRLFSKISHLEKVRLSGKNRKLSNLETAKILYPNNLWIMYFLVGDKAKKGYLIMTFLITNLMQDTKNLHTDIY